MNKLNIHLEDLPGEYEELFLEDPSAIKLTDSKEHIPDIIDISNYPGVSYILTEEGEKPLYQVDDFNGNLLHPNISVNITSIVIDGNRPKHGFKLKLDRALEEIDVHCNCRSFTSETTIKRININMTNENSIQLNLYVGGCSELNLNLIAPKLSFKIFGCLPKNCVHQFNFSKASEIKFLPIEDSMGNEIGSSRSNLLLDDPRELARCFFTPEELKMIDEYRP